MLELDIRTCTDTCQTKRKDQLTQNLRRHIIIITSLTADTCFKLRPPFRTVLAHKQTHACTHERMQTCMYMQAGTGGGREGWMDGFALNFLIYLTLLNLFEASVVASDGRVVCRSRCCLAASHSLKTSLLLGLRRPRPCRSLMPKPLPIRRSSAAGRALSSSLP